MIKAEHLKMYKKSQDDIYRETMYETLSEIEAQLVKAATYGNNKIYLKNYPEQKNYLALIKLNNSIKI